MPMDRQNLLNAIIDDGVTEIPLAYPRPDQKDKREGGIAGFEACRGLDDDGIVSLLAQARDRTAKAMTTTDPGYWHHRMYELQIEWVLNVLSAAATANGMKAPAGYTARGMLKAADVLGIAA